jgi:D-galactarolactone cycloisomerase
MKIVEVTGTALSKKLEGMPRRGIGRPIKKDTVIVRVRTEDGIIGYGQAHDTLAPTIVADIVSQNLAPLTVGMDVMAVEDIWQNIYLRQGQTHGPGAALFHALSGVDMALWDARGKALGQPVYRLLGGAKKKIRAYVGGSSFGFKPPAALLEEAQGYVAAGFTALKLRLGDTVENDVARVRAVRNGLGDGVDIMVDANTQYSQLDAQRALPALEECNVFWLEEPFPPDAFSHYAHLNQRTRIPIAGGENHYFRYQFRQLLEMRAVDIVQPDPARSGGITECKKIADLAAAFRCAFAPHITTSGLDNAACVHLLCATSNALICEADCSPVNPFRDELVLGAPIIKDGYVEPNDAPGLGVEVDEGLFAKYPGIPGPCIV